MSITIETAIKGYLRLRDEKSRIENNAKNEVGQIKEKMQKIEAWLLDKTNKDGVDSFKTEHGTAYKTEKTYARVSEWDKFLEHVLSTENYQLLKRDVAKTAVVESMSESGEVPPGVDYGSRFEINVRQPTKRK